MTYSCVSICIVAICISVGHCQQHRSPPGVNPSQYNSGQPNPGSYQQQQQHQQPQHVNQPYANEINPPQGNQQPPQQYQPAPQQQHQPAPQQQQYQAPSELPRHQQKRVLHNENIDQERDHIKDHLEVPLDTSGMSEEELQFHYFKMHDADNNNKLDGQELIKSLFHWHDSSNHDTKTEHTPPPGPKIFTDEELVNMIDPILDQDDKNRDGFIDYPEFVQAQRAAAASASANANANTAAANAV